MPPTTNWKQSIQSITLSSGQNAANINFATLPLYSFAVTDLGTLGGASSSAVAMNNVGQIVGEADTATAVNHPFLYTIATGKFTDLSGVLGAKAVVNDIDDLGQMVGEIPNGKTDSGGGPATQGFVYSGGKLTLLPLPSGTEDGTAIGINNKGQIVAEATTLPSGLYNMSYIQAYLYSASTGKLVSSVPQEYEDVGALAINNSGQIFENSYYPAFKSEGGGGNFLYSGGKLITLPAPAGTSAPGPWFGSPVDVSLANTVGDNGNATNPATFYSGEQAVTLSDALPANSKWNLESANGITSSNMIVGAGVNPQGKTHAYLLTQVLASISGTVFDDVNGDGVKQPAEPGLAGWTVYADLKGDDMYDPGDPMTTTTATGGYTITGLPAGGFTIRILPKTGYRETSPTVFSQTIVAPGQSAAGPSFGEVLTGPYGGSPAPFTTIQAENFDLGGQGAGYYNPGNVNKGGLYRPLEGVGIGAIPTADGGGYFVGYTQPGEYLNYTVAVAATGTYTLNFRVASNPAGGKFHLNVDGTNVTGTLSVPNTGNFNTYQIVAKTGIHLTAGTHVLQLVIDSKSASYGAAGNFDWIQAVKTA
jgi:probable HAF family extracellular repeat protein